MIANSGAVCKPVNAYQVIGSVTVIFQYSVAKTSNLLNYGMISPFQLILAVK